MIIRVYVAGPYTQGDPAVNVKNAIDAGNKLFEAGLYPYIPHLSHFIHMLHPRPYEDWMRLDLAWLEKCDIMLRLSGASPGADVEEMKAKEDGIVVFYSIEETIGYYREHYEADR